MSTTIRVYLLQPIDETELINLIPALAKEPHNLPPVRSHKVLTVVRLCADTQALPGRRFCPEKENSGVVVFLPLA